MIDAGSGVAVKMTNNELERANISVSGKALQGEAVKATGTLNGDYLLGDAAGFAGEATLTVVEDIQWHDGRRFDIQSREDPRPGLAEFPKIARKLARKLGASVGRAENRHG